ncbi:hypothetical protein R6L23_22355 [Streptomyces sp. SR27]|uniref:hypothetical protein n=1 Tax=unclassified Streptomyces TaxID=2593676 RepID=UPI00295B664D|nr:hypothetical protein [Streptomyces sp. SR27]MDV9190921.1 hypothetical protein [Streptomyces sp. SR27]
MHPHASRLAFAAAIALIVVTLAAFWAWRWWEGEREGEFKADPQFCELVTPETIHRLVPEAYARSDDDRAAVRAGAVDAAREAAALLKP